MSRFTKALVLGCCIGILGILVSIVPFGSVLEEDIGLDLLFHLRGARKPPPDVVVVSIDRFSALKLNLPDDPEKWPRSVHARLTDVLAKAGASVIVFDILFSEPHNAEEDGLFAHAIGDAQNVLLCEIIKRKILPLNGGDDFVGHLNIEKLVKPVSSLETSSLALAPFPLPRIPINVRQYWTFKTSAGDTPTMPVVAFQVYALEVYDEFIRLLRKTGLSGADSLPDSRNELIAGGSVERVVRDIRNLFVSEPVIAAALLEELENSPELSIDVRMMKMLASLVRMYQGPNSKYLNFYGYPRTVPTIPYYQVLAFQDESEVGRKHPDLNGKAVFVGHSENLRPEFKDGFYTVFSQPDGVDMSGVEIAATAFANLLEDSNIRRLALSMHLFTVLLWGLIMGVACRFFSHVYALGSVAGMCVLYVIFVSKQFAGGGMWYPFAVPLFFQAPLAAIGSILCKYFDTARERRNIKKAISYYLPDDVIDRISKNITDLGAGNKVVYGTCLSSDAEDYTSMAENMNPEELNIFMNRYYEAIFRPVRQYGGIVANVIADEMLAIWVTGSPDNTSSKNACFAALNISDTVSSKSNGNIYLPTRVGIHSGPISLGNIGAGDHYEYRPVGDIVNTATRIEGLNKYLGTRILISSEVLNQLNGFLSRELGTFLPAGKSQSLVLHELLCPADRCSQDQKELCTLFAEGLAVFRQGSWGRASGVFTELLQRFGQDGPSLFYKKLCEEYIKNPSEKHRGEVVRLNNK